MSIESAKVLRNGKVLTNSSPHSPTKTTNLDLNSNMESSSNSADETNQSGRNSPTNKNSTQRDNEERFNRLHDEMAMLKAMMEKIINQNEERDKHSHRIKSFENAQKQSKLFSFSHYGKTLKITSDTTRLVINCKHYKNTKNSGKLFDTMCCQKMFSKLYSTVSKRLHLSSQNAWCLLPKTEGWIL